MSNVVAYQRLQKAQSNFQSLQTKLSSASRLDGKARNLTAALMLGATCLTPLTLWSAPAHASCTVNAGPSSADYVVSNPAAPAPVNLDTDCPGSPTGELTVEIPTGAAFDRLGQHTGITAGGGATWTVVNNGAVRASDLAISLRDGPHVLINAGEISKTDATSNRAQIEIGDGGRIVNEAGGVISGAGPVIGLGDLTTDNAGVISNTASRGSGLGTTRGDAELLVTNRNGAVISGEVGIFSPGALELENSGDILGVSISPRASNGIAVGGPVTIVNHAGGSIEGDFAISAVSDMTLVNAGRINGEIVGYGGSNMVELREGYEINGSVNMVNGTSTLRLGGGRGEDATLDVSLIDTGANTAQYRGFDVFEKTGDAVWNLEGDNEDLAVDWKVRNGVMNIHSSAPNMSVTVEEAGHVQNFTGEIASASLSGRFQNSGGRVAGAVTVEDGGMYYAGAGEAGALHVKRGGVAANILTAHVAGDSIVEGAFANHADVGGAVTVRDGGFYFSSGSAGALTVEAGGRMEPVGYEQGSQFATLTTGDLSLAGTLDFQFERGGAQDLVDVAGSVDITGATLNLQASGLVAEEMPIFSHVAIINNDGDDAVIGNFTHDFWVNAAGDLFFATNTLGGDGNDVDLDMFRTAMTLRAGEANDETVAFADGFDTFTFTVDGADRATFSGTFSEKGAPVSLAKAGDGSLEITGDNTFTGLTRIDAGALINNGALASAVAVNDGALYGGDGVSGDLFVNAGGVVAPGNSIGALTVNGDVAFNDGATYLAEIAPDGAADLIAASGMATISGVGTTLSAIGDPAADFPDTQTFTVLTAAGGVTGTFETVTDNLPDIDLQAVYNSDSVQLTYTQATTPEPPTTEPPVTGPSMPTNPTPAPVPNPTPTFSPKEAHPSALMAGVEGSHLFAETLRRRGGLHMHANDFLRASQGPALDKNALWMAPMGARSDVESSGDAVGWKAGIGGLGMGFERKLSDTVTAGFAGGFTRTSVDAGAADADIETWHAGLYASAALEALTLSGALAYASHDYDIDRVITYGGGATVANGDAKGDSYTLSGEAFYDITTRADGRTFRLGPLATISAVHATRDGFTETGAGVLNLTVDEDDATQVVTGLGGALGFNRVIARARVAGDLRVQWEHVAGDGNASTVSTIPLANAHFVASSAEIDRNRLAVGAGAAIVLTDTLNLHARYDGAFSGGAREHRASAGLTLRF